MKTKQTKRQSGVSLLFILVAIVVTVLAALKIQDMRGRASTPGGSGAYILSPATTLIPGQQSSITITASIGTKLVDGFQVFATLSGTIPPDLYFYSENLAGLRYVMNAIEPTSTPNTKTFKLLYMTENPTIPFSSTQLITLGKLSFTVPAQGALTIAMDPRLTKIVEHDTVQDIVAQPPYASYVFGAPTGISLTPVPSRPPTSAPTVRPGIPTNTLAPTTKPSLKPTTTPQPSASCKGRPDGTRCSSFENCPVCRPEDTFCMQRPCVQSIGICRKQECITLRAVTPNPLPTRITVPLPRVTLIPRPPIPRFPISIPWLQRFFQ